MYVDPLLLAVLVVLLVATSALALVAYARYRRCEGVYQAYGLSKQVLQPERTTAPADDRYVTGADYAAEPVLAVSRPEPDEPAPAAPQPVRIEAPEPEPESVAAEALAPEPPAPQPEPLFVSEESAPADSFFYEYTSEGFVPVDPYEPEPLPRTGAEAEQPPDGDEFALAFTIEEMPEPAHPEAPQPAAPAPEPVAEPDDGFVWL